MYHMIPGTCYQEPAIWYQYVLSIVYLLYTYCNTWYLIQYVVLVGHRRHKESHGNSSCAVDGGGGGGSRSIKLQQQCGSM